MSMKSRIAWDKVVDWSMTDAEIAALFRYSEKYVYCKRLKIVGPSGIKRPNTFGVRLALTEELNTAIRRAAGKSGLSFSEWMRRAAEMKLAAEESVHG